MKRALVLASFCLSLAGCFFDPAHTGLSCGVDDDCGQGASCVGGYCVSDSEEPEPDMSTPTEDMSGPEDMDVPAVPTRIEVEPPTAQIAIGVSVQLSATVFDADDQVIDDAEIDWTSGDDTIATVSASGAVTGTGPGVVDVTASLGALSATATVTVLAPVASVVIEPASPMVGQGRSLQLTARALDGNGDELPGRTISWASQDSTVGEVDANGLVTGLLVGATDITASSEGVDGTVTLQVVQNDVASVELTPQDATIEQGLVRVYEAVIRDAEGESLDPRNRTYLWDASNDSVIALSQPPGAPHQQRAQGINLGNSQLSVVVDGGPSAALDIEVIERVIGSVEILALNETVPVGSTRQLTAEVKDLNGLVITGRAETWSSSDTAVADVDADGLLTALAPGTTTITVDVEGFMATLPVETAFLLDSIVASNAHSCGVNPDGVALCWGQNNDKELGNSSVGGSSAQPVVVEGGIEFVQIVAGNDHTCGLDTAGTAHCWGKAGFLGTANGSGSAVPVAVGTPTFSSLAAGAKHTCGVTPTDEVWCWGTGGDGQLGDGNSADSDPPVRVSLTPVGVPVALAAGTAHTCVATDAAKTYCWGKGANGALGDGMTMSQPTPVEVVGAPAFVELSLGDQSSCGRTAANAVHCWGSNADGRLGIGDISGNDVLQPTALPNASFTAVDLGPQHGCGLNALDGAVHCWGLGTDFRLGDTTEDTRYAPVPNAANLAAIAVSAGGTHSCAIAQDLTPYCWGNNANGRSGTASGATLDQPQPVWPTP